MSRRNWGYTGLEWRREHANQHTPPSCSTHPRQWNAEHTGTHPPARATKCTDVWTNVYCDVCEFIWVPEATGSEPSRSRGELHAGKYLTLDFEGLAMPFTLRNRSHSVLTCVNTFNIPTSCVILSTIERIDWSQIFQIARVQKYVKYLKYDIYYKTNFCLGSILLIMFIEISKCIKIHGLCINLLIPTLPDKLIIKGEK